MMITEAVLGDWLERFGHTKRQLWIRKNDLAFTDKYGRTNTFLLADTLNNEDAALCDAKRQYYYSESFRKLSVDEKKERIERLGADRSTEAWLRAQYAL